MDRKVHQNVTTLVKFGLDFVQVVYLTHFVSVAQGTILDDNPKTTHLVWTC
jgi:hypothetical protein